MTQTYADTIKDKCNEAMTLIERSLEDNKKLDDEFQEWGKTYTDSQISLELLRRIKRLLATLERITGKLEVSRDTALFLKEQGGKDAEKSRSEN